MSRRIFTIEYNFQPEFPAATVERYPSLTSALGGNYPRLIVPVIGDEQSPWDTSSRQPTVPAASTEPGRLAPDDRTSPERIHTSSPDGSILSNNDNSSSEPRQDQAHSRNTSVGAEYFVHIYNSDGPRRKTMSDRGNLHSPSEPPSPLPGTYNAATLLGNLPRSEATFSNDERQVWCPNYHAEQNRSSIRVGSSGKRTIPPSWCSIPVSRPPGTEIFPEDEVFLENRPHEGISGNYFHRRHRSLPAHALNSAHGPDYLVPFSDTFNHLLDTMSDPGNPLHLQSDYSVRERDKYGTHTTTHASNSAYLRSSAVGSASALPYFLFNYHVPSYAEPHLSQFNTTSHPAPLFSTIAKFPTHAEPQVHASDLGDRRTPPMDSALVSSYSRAEHHKHTKLQGDILKEAGESHSVRSVPERRSTRLHKSYDCPVCHKSFHRQSILRTHENIHTSKQAFACDATGCAKKFGLRSNLQRHQHVVHGIRRMGKRSSISEYKVEFEPPTLSTSLLSDATSMPSGIIWDNEGPLSRREIHWPGSETAHAEPEK
ncbi:hypothetical protein C8R45DRAFT_986994 [Mycena sanguinolenta]|nr:hypothetical protein C8R45DRAFT_986994 [Mycena sanguinolenta]